MYYQYIYEPTGTSGSATAEPNAGYVPKSQLEIAKYLLDHAADPNQKALGRSPLHFAVDAIPVYSNFDTLRDGPAVTSAVEMIRLLVGHGARLDVRWEGHTPAELAETHFNQPIELNEIKLGAVDTKGPIPQAAEEIATSKSSTTEPDRKKFYDEKRREVLALLAPDRKDVPAMQRSGTP